MADAAFETISPPTTVGVRDISYKIFDPDPDGEESQAMTYEAQIVWSDGSITIKANNLVPHLTSAEINALQTLAARLRSKAETAWGDAP